MVVGAGRAGAEQSRVAAELAMVRKENDPRRPPGRGARQADRRPLMGAIVLPAVAANRGEHSGAHPESHATLADAGKADCQTSTTKSLQSEINMTAGLNTQHQAPSVTRGLSRPALTAQPPTRRRVVGVVNDRRENIAIRRTILFAKRRMIDVPPLRTLSQPTKLKAEITANRTAETEERFAPGHIDHHPPNIPIHQFDVPRRRQPRIHRAEKRWQ